MLEYCLKYQKQCLLTNDTEHQINSLFTTLDSNLQDIADNRFMSKKCLEIV